MDKRTKDMIFDGLLAITIYFFVKYLMNFSEEISLVAGLIVLMGFSCVTHMNYVYRKLTKVE
jgi:hypothetical protein